MSKRLDNIIKEVGGSLLPIDDVIKHALGIAKKLQKIHKKGNLHCNITPTNILINISDQVEILNEKSVIDSYRYRSPEQIRGEKFDQRTDIWSLGVVIYELATGKVPFKGNNEDEVANLILNEKHRPPSELRSDIPKKLESLINKALQKSQKNRHEDLTEVMDDLKLAVLSIGFPKLLKQLNNEDEIAKSILEKLRNGLKGFFSRIQKLADSAEDLADKTIEDIAYKVFLGKIVLIGAPKGLFLTEARHKMLEALRERKRESPLPDEDLEDDNIPIDEKMEKDEIKSIFVKCKQRCVKEHVREEYRDQYLGHYESELPISKVKHKNEEEGAVRVRLWRFNELVKECIILCLGKNGLKLSDVKDAL